MELSFPGMKVLGYEVPVNNAMMSHYSVAAVQTVKLMMMMIRCHIFYLVVIVGNVMLF